MQNMDFYTGQPGIQASHPQYVAKDPEYFARMTMHHNKDKEKSQNRAARTLSIVLGLCILSFTSGLIVGIRFTGNRDGEIVDEQTREAVNSLGANLGTRMNTMIQNADAPAESGTEQTVGQNPMDGATTVEQQNTAATAAIVEEKPKEPVTRTFPKEEYPWVIKVGELFSADQAKNVADYLSSRGHTVILTRAETLYRVYLGPYKSETAAQSNISRINNYTDNTYFNSISVVKR